MLSMELWPTGCEVDPNRGGANSDSPAILPNGSLQSEVPMVVVVVVVDERENDRASEPPSADAVRVGREVRAGEADTTGRSWKVNRVEPK